MKEILVSDVNYFDGTVEFARNHYSRPQWFGHFDFGERLQLLCYLTAMSIHLLCRAHCISRMLPCYAILQLALLPTSTWVSLKRGLMVLTSRIQVFTSLSSCILCVRAWVFLNMCLWGCTHILRLCACYMWRMSVIYNVIFE